MRLSSLLRTKENELNIVQDFDPKAVLADTLPSFLEEGPLLVELKTTPDTCVKPALIVTRSEDYCNMEEIPEDNCDEYSLWAWNLHKGGWVLLDLADIETIQTWPVESA